MSEPGTIVLIPFPFSDLMSSKRRPVMMLTAPDTRDDFMAMPMTSKPQTEPALRIEAGPLPAGGSLPLTSWVKTETAVCLSASQIVKVLGRASEAQRSYCIQQFCQYLRQGR